MLIVLKISCSVAKSCLILCHPMDCSTPRRPSPSLSPRVCSNSCLSSWWCCLTTSAAPFFFCLQSSPASRSFPVRWHRVRWLKYASTVVLPMNIQGWFPLGLTGLISLLSKGLCRVFSSTAFQKYQFFSAQPSLWSDSHICTWLQDFPGGSDGKASVYDQETQVQSLGWEDPLETEMAIHSNTVAWKIPWTEDPARL